MHNFTDINRILDENAQSKEGFASDYFRKTEGLYSAYQENNLDKHENKKSGRTPLERHEEPNFVSKLINLGFSKFF